jgi:hypothetical protein
LSNENNVPGAVTAIGIILVRAVLALLVAVAHQGHMEAKVKAINIQFHDNAHFGKTPK